MSTQFVPMNGILHSQIHVSILLFRYFCKQNVVVSAGFGTQVTDCVAHDGTGETSQRLLDEWGCAIDELILPAMRPISQDSSGFKLRLQVTGATFAAFKFPDRNSLHLRCTLQLCRGSCIKVNTRTPSTRA